MPAGRPRIDRYADADILVLTRADEIFRLAVPPITPTKGIQRVVRAVLRANEKLRAATPTITRREALTPLGEDARWCLDPDGKPLQIGGPANFDAIVKRLLSRLEPTRFTKRGKRVATLPPRIRHLAIAKAIDSRRGWRRKLPGD